MRQELEDLDDIDARRSTIAVIKHDIKAQKKVILSYAKHIGKLERECSDLQKQVEIDKARKDVIVSGKGLRDDLLAALGGA